MDYFLFHIFQNIEFVSYYLYRYPRIFKKNFLGEVKGSTDLTYLMCFNPREIFFFSRYSLCPMEIFSCLFWSHFDMNSVYCENFISVMKNTLDSSCTFVHFLTQKWKQLFSMSSGSLWQKTTSRDHSHSTEVTSHKL